MTKLSFGRFHFLNREFNVFSNYSHEFTKILVLKTEKVEFLENELINGYLALPKVNFEYQLLTIDNFF
ncbi:hypothetical protein BLOT_014188 [Blomia tropicalis]|nr:hypothetical protein BLOT_014188 [Blomia tropicalis]